MEEARPIPPFRCNQIESSKLSKEWRTWRESLECYFAAYNITDQQLMRAKLLHLGGPALQAVFKNLRDREHVPIVSLVSNWYDIAVEKLDEFFEPRHQSTSERRKLRLMKQKSGERFADYVVRLKQQAAECGFDKYGPEIEEILTDIHLTDAVVEGCISNDVRKRILLKDLPFSDIEALGIGQEGVDQQIADISSHQPSEKIYRVGQNTNQRDAKASTSFGSSPREKSCFNCGRAGHIATAAVCPARGKQCRNCKIYGHFEKFCRKQKRKASQDFREKKVRIVEDTSKDELKDVLSDKDDSQDKVYYAFYSGNESNLVPGIIGGIKVDLLIDSGADANLISEDVWTRMKNERISVISSSKGSSRILRAYGSDRPLMILGSFIASVTVGCKEVNAEFLVVKGGQRCLLGDQTAKLLGVLKVGLHINEVKKNHQPFSKIHGIKAHIRLDPTFVPVFQPVRRVPLPLEEAVKRKLNELLERDIIEVKSGTASWVSPLVVVGKANGEPRLCLDLRRVNEAVMRERHPMPVVDEFLARIGRGKLWSKLDIREAFLQMELDEDSRDATTFITSSGLFRFKRLPFGLITAPELFQKAMTEILTGCDGTFWYIDDVIVEGETMEQHDERLQKVLSRLKERGVELNWGKCQLRVTEIDFLGHHISQNGISPSKLKTQALLSFREPQNEGELRSFLGLANYMNKFIPNLATIDEPLRKLLLKDSKFEWKEAQIESFKQIKLAMSDDKQLGFYKVEDRTAVITDASPVGLGAILVQFDKDGSHRVICAASKSLTGTERRYCQTEKEALAIVWSVERFQNYLLGKMFDIFTDCKALSFLFSKRSKPCARIERWVLRLQMFDYRVIHIAGRDNVADCLSRLAVMESKPFDSAEEIMVQEVVMQAVASSALTWKEIEEDSMKDAETRQILEILSSGNLQTLPLEYRVVANELCELQNVLLRGDRIVVPKQLRDKVLATAHEGHPGITMMKNHLRSNVWWPKMDADVEKMVKNCRGCTLVAAPSRPEPMVRSELPVSPWHTVALDFLGPLPEGQYLLVVIDCYTRFMEVCEMESITASDVIRELSVRFGRYGIPHVLKADNAPQFSSECGEFKEFCNANGVQIRNTIPYWPQSNGEVERQNRSILKRLRIAQELGHDWRRELCDYLLTYHSTKHPTTGRSPGELMFGRKIKSKLPTLPTFVEDETVRERDLITKEKGKQYSDKKRGAKESEFEVGDRVIIKRMKKTNKLDTEYMNEDYVVVKKTGTDTIVKSTTSGKEYRRCSAHVKKVADKENMVTDGEHTESSQQLEQSISLTNFGKLCNGSNREETEIRKRHQPAKFKDYISY